MNSILRLAITLAFAGLAGSAGAATGHRCGMRHLPDSTAQAYSSDSIRAFFSRFSSDTVNIYRVRPDLWRKVLPTVFGYNKLYLFNEDGSTVQLHDPRHCANISKIIEHTLPSTVDRSKSFETFISMCDAMAPATWKRDQFTAMIFWNRAIGITPDDCPFEWARQLRFKYGKNIQIIWVNTDISDNGDPALREEALATMNGFLSRSIRELF